MSFQSYFEIREDGVHPSPAAVSPWNAEHQSGVAVSGLLTNALESTPSETPMMFARIVIDIVRPVPMKPLQLTTRVTRDGRRMQTLSAELSFQGEVVAAASALRVRLAQTPKVMPQVSYPKPDEAPRTPLIRRDPLRNGVETRVVKGRLIEPGPGVLWGRVATDFLPGLPASPLVTAMMVCDIGSAISAELDSRQWTFANMDVSAHFVRPPRSDWCLIDAQTITHGDGVAIVDTTVCDEEGLIGHAHQTLFIAPLGR